MNELYNRIQDKALEKGLTLGGMCVMADVNKSRMSDLKSGRIKTLNTVTLQKIAKVLGTTPDALLNGEGDRRIIHMDLDSKKFSPRLICESLTDAELMEMLSAVTKEVQRRNHMKEV